MKYVFSRYDFLTTLSGYSSPLHSDPGPISSSSSANKLLSDQKGVSMVELAIALPLLMVFIAGIIDYGLGVQTLNNISGAARAGVRAGAQASEIQRMADGSLDPNSVIACGFNIGQTPEFECGGFTTPLANGAASTMSEAALRAACSYLDRWNMASGRDFVVRMSLKESAAAPRQYQLDLTTGTGISFPPPKILTVEVLKNPDTPDAALCAVCVDAFVPALRHENIIAKSTMVMGGDCQ